ncbi:DNA-binding SARP family transcriptional activator [Catenuloplanes nepalensis]|uniref:DNA-binding SARP family transcriptional activator n=1 Tax=Catenuloplanes nepalensis TaxID=587533 RepID=A0ABT9N4U8_9ACTN|nr:BTAD domain-containing putative transcriptional regulator [Catenuloplanes nepalensis]MDP9798730.1 DNA-binding SARP family transcriptional activator [Catenuloplanes nepalensis]
MTVTFGVLGPLTAEFGDGGPVVLRGNRQRAVLARLLVAHGRVVPVDTLVDDLWPDDPPDRAVASIRTFVADLRRALEPDRPPRRPPELLVTAPPGYALHATSIDASRFADAVHAAGLPPDAALTRLDDALALWRGPAYGEFAAEGWARAEIDHLDELRALAVERRATALLDLSRPADAVPSLLAHTAAAPLREEAWHLLATALYRTGRQGDALAALRTARETLADQLGVDPGPRLRALESAILTQDPNLSRVRPTARIVPTDTSRRAPSDLAVPVTPRSARFGNQPLSPDRPTGRIAEFAGRTAEPAGRAPEFVGRAEERAQLAAVARTATLRQRPALALISGDAGAGKTALAESLVTDLSAAGWTTVWGRCPEYEGAPVAWPWLQISDTLSGGGEAARGGPDGHETANGDVSSAAGSSGSGSGSGSEDPAAARFRLRRVMAGLIEGAAERAPVLIVLDDLHWADEGTLDLLAGLLAGPEAAAGPVLIVGTYRTTEITPDLAVALARLARVEPVRVYLGGLPADAIGDLAAAVTGHDLAPDVVERLHRRTGGNPFFARELARVLAAEGVDALDGVPAGVRDVLRHRLTRLPESARELLRRAAVLGRDIDPDLLAALSDLDDDALLDALDLAVAAGLLTESAGRLRFTHILVRDTLYGDLSALRRSRWHAAAGTALERLRPDDPAPLAHHFSLAGAGHAPHAARHARAAAEQAERRGNPHEAARMWQRALDAHDLITGAHTLATRAAENARAAGDAGAADDTRATDARATDAQVTGARAADARERLSAVMGLGRALAVVGRLAEARRHRADAIDAAEALGDPVAAAIAVTSFNVPAVWPRNDDEELSARIVAAAERTLAALDRAERAGPGTGSPDGTTRQVSATRMQAAGRTADGSLELSAEGGVRLRSRLLSTIALELRGDTGTRGETAAREAERLARASGEPDLLAFALNARFIHCFGRAGLSAERAAIGAELVALAARHRLVTFEVLGHLILLQSSCARGDLPAADRHAADADRLAARYELPVVGVFTGWYAGLRHALHDDLVAAEAAYRAAAARMTGSGMPGVEDGLLPLALLSLDPGSDVDDAGPYEPWVRPLRLIARGDREAAAAALHDVPESPRDLLMEARLWLLAHAAAELGDTAVHAHAHAALRPADGELAGGASGILSFGRISQPG